MYICAHHPVTFGARSRSSGGNGEKHLTHWNARGLSAVRFDWHGYALGLSILLVGIGAQGQHRDASPTAPATAVGRKVYSSNCSACHGLDGRGSERAPDIATKRDVQQLSDATLFGILDKGISGTGMPAFRSLGKSQIEAAIQYLRELQGMRGGTLLAGDPPKGETLFFGNAQCSQCHMIRGRGGFLGSDLSDYASARRVDDIRNAITQPGAKENRANQVVIVTTREGGILKGVVRNEDNFSLQIQTLDGAFHSLQKSDLQSTGRSGDSLMPSDYGSRLTRSELDDLAAFLVRASQGANPNGGPGLQSQKH